MNITGLRLTNFGRFRGDQELLLTGGVYAVVAGDAADPRRSNWLGKTTLLASIRWALHGELPWATIDDAISRGEREMAVDVELGDGTFVSRSKSRGKSAVLRVVVPDGAGERELFGVPAQDELDARVGFSAADFAATVWLEQKAASRFVVARPADRTAMVAEWLALAPLQAAAEAVQRDLAALEAKLIRETATLASVTAGDPDPPEELRAEVARCEQDVRAAGEMADAWTARAREIDAYDRAVERRGRLEAARRELVEAEREAPEEDAAEVVSAAEAAVVVAKRNREESRREAERLRGLTAGKFDGRCPVICGECPVPDQILGEKAKIQEAWEAAEARVMAASEVARTAETTARGMLQRRQAWAAWRNRVQRLMDRVRDLEEEGRRDGTFLSSPRPDPWDPVDVAGPAAALATSRERLRRAEAAAGLREKSQAEVDRLASEAKVHRIAARILGRGGAQRRISQEALGRIESGANRLLAGAGVELTVRLVFGRELQGPAEVCDCGRAFPKTATARACEGCGEPRGRKRDDKLYVELSDRSGAAEDLAGVALQVAAARWLRAARGAAWGVLALDEPFGALDAAHRPALARALLSLVREGFEQAFVIAHSSDTLEAFPHRIVIRSSGAWSTVSVE